MLYQQLKHFKMKGANWLNKAHVSSGEITGEHFGSLEYSEQKCGTFSNSAAQLSVLNSS